MSNPDLFAYLFSAPLRHEPATGGIQTQTAALRPANEDLALISGEIRRCLRPNCGNTFAAGKVKGRERLYCCRACKSAHQNQRLRDQRNLAVGHLKRVCMEGLKVADSIIEGGQDTRATLRVEKERGR